MEKTNLIPDVWDEVSAIIATTKYRLPVNRLVDKAIYVVDVRKVMEILKTKYTIKAKPNI